MQGRTFAAKRRAIVGGVQFGATPTRQRRAVTHALGRGGIMLVARDPPGLFVAMPPRDCRVVPVSTQSIDRG